MSGYDIGIIGAGAHGASVAYHLGRAGVSTVVFERGTPASGPTGRSSAICRSLYTQPFLARMARDSIAMLPHFNELTGGGSADFVRAGMLFLYGEQHVDEVAPLVQALTALEIDVSAVGVDALSAERPALCLDGVGAAIWEPGWALSSSPWRSMPCSTRRVTASSGTSATRPIRTRS